MSIFTFVGISVIGVLGSYLVTGLTGMFSLGQGALMAVGAYVSGLLVIKLGLPFPIACVLAVMTSVGLAAIIGSVALRLRQDYFSLLTFGFGEAIRAVLNVSVNLSGGASGLTGIPIKVDFLTVVISLVVLTFITYKLKSTTFGRRSLAIRDNELAAEVLGIPVLRHKMKAFVIGAAFASFAGCLFVFYTSYIDPSMFGWMKSAEWIIMVFFGGRGSLTGAVASSLVLLSLPELLRFADEYRTIVYCVVVILILSFRPNGIMGDKEFSIKAIVGWFRRPTKKTKASAAEGGNTDV